MARSTPGRSGDPRKRAAAAVVPRSSARRRLAAVGVVLGAAGAVGALGARGTDGPDDEVRARAEVACDFTDRAAEAADRPTRARLAAAVLLLDQAVVASERAARSHAGYRSLDEAVQAVHAAGHVGDPVAWTEALERAVAACSVV